MQEEIVKYLHKKLNELGTGGFERLALETGVAVSFIRKFHYGLRENPRVATVQPLLDYFRRQEAIAKAAIDEPVTA